MRDICALIAEDEPILAQILVNTLQVLWPELEICAVVDNGMLAVQETLVQRPDILFFDIKMPGKTGLEAVHELVEQWPGELSFPMLVFVTAYDQFALDAFEFAAIDYVLKPVNIQRLSKTVERLQQRLTQNIETGSELERIVGQLRLLAAPIPSIADPLTMIRAAVGNQIRLIPIQDVIYFEAVDKYVNVVTAESESLIRTSLKDLLQQLDRKHFWQIHRGTIVNVSYINAAVRNELGKLSIKLHGRPEVLQVSRVFAHLFKQM